MFLKFLQEFEGLNPLENHEYRFIFSLYMMNFFFTKYVFNFYKECSFLHQLSTEQVYRLVGSKQRVHRQYSYSVR